MAMLWTAQADAGDACFESKYHFYFWRPQSAIPLAETDGNAATEADGAWLPSCRRPITRVSVRARLRERGGAEVLEAFYGTKKITYTFSSTVTNTTQTYNSTDEMLNTAAGCSHPRRHALPDRDGARPRARHEGRQVGRKALLHAGGLSTG